MLTLPLAPTDDKAKPAFKDVAGCVSWLGQLQLTNIQRAHSLLLAQLNELNRCPIRGIDRLGILETLRETISYIQNDYAKKLIAKPLPYNESELMIFAGITQLWQAMVLGYQRCLQAHINQDANLTKYGALLSYRCLLYSGLQLFEHLRSGYEFDPKLWYQMHALYAFAESQDLHLVEVPDALNEYQSRCTSRSVYVKTLLACYARPAELTRTQLQCMDRWLSSWVKDVNVDTDYHASKGDATPLAINYASTHGLQPLQMLPKAGEHIRYLPMVPLSKLLRVKIILLQQGQTPQQVELGEYVSRNESITLLTFLHQCWCEDRNVRATERRAVTLDAHICSKHEAIYAHLAGRSFKQPDPDAALEKKRKQALNPFAAPEPIMEEYPELDFPLEEWHIENESLLGAKVIRDDLFGMRLSCTQLIALRPSDAKIFMLGVCAWLTVTSNAKLAMGIRYLPGVASPIAIRLTGANLPQPNKYVPAFWMQAVPALKTPASLILPRDYFQPERIIEIIHSNDDMQKVRLVTGLERGVDYERVTFEVV